MSGETATPYDIAIIGTGPAGISAAITAKARNKSILLFGRAGLSEKLSKAHVVGNYPGLPNIAGADLAAAFANHLSLQGIAITDRLVTAIYPREGGFSVLADNEVYEARTVIIATGIRTVREIPGESQYLGRGVSYCATCDGNFYRGKNIAVIGYSPSDEAEVAFLADIAAKVFYIPLYAGTPAVNVDIVRETPQAIEGSAKAERIRTDKGTIEVDGIFVLRDSVAIDALLPGIDVEDGQVSVDRQFATNVPGVFAAGDVTGKLYQYAKAIGEGNVAAISAAAMIDKAENARTKHEHL